MVPFLVNMVMGATNPRVDRRSFHQRHEGIIRSKAGEKKKE